MSIASLSPSASREFLSSTINIPPSRTYAVAQLDIDATIAHVVDEDVRAEVLKIGTARCLIYLHTYGSAMCTWQPYETFTYGVSAIGRGLRPADPKEHITPDMCVPIFPAVEHPKGRAPLRTSRAFPFSDCYHWYGVDLDVRMKRGEYSHDEGDYVGLSVDESIRMYGLHAEDEVRVVTARTRNESSGTPGEPGALPMSVHSPSPPTSSSPHTKEPVDIASATRASSTPQIRQHNPPTAVSPASPSSVRGMGWQTDDAVSARSSHVASESMALRCDESLFTHFSERSFDTLDLMSLYELKGIDTTTRLPVVDIWLDLTAHMTQDDIPDPMIFMEKCEGINRILSVYQEKERAVFETKLHQCRERHAQEQQEGLDKESHYTASVWGPEESHSSGTQPESGHRRWQRVRAGAASALAVCRSLLCLV